MITIYSYHLQPYRNKSNACSYSHRSSINHCLLREVGISISTNPIDIQDILIHMPNLTSSLPGLVVYHRE